MVKKTNREMIAAYIKTRDDITEQTRKQYLATANSLGFSILYTEPTIIKYLKDGAWNNPNTLASHLNIIILARNHLEEPVKQLIKYRNSLKDEIIELRKKKMTESKKELPSYEELLKTLDKMVAVPYLINYSIINFGLRNKDQNLRFYTEPPKETNENYIIHSSKKSKKVTLIINDYKTDKKYKTKNIDIDDKKYIKELVKLNLSDGDYLMPKRDGGKMKLSTFNDRVKTITIDSIGEADLFKIVFSYLLQKNDYNAIEKLVYSRGVSMTTMLKSYNLHNNSKNKAEPTSVKELKEGIDGDESSE